jgi:hypothetical protein
MPIEERVSSAIDQQGDMKDATTEGVKNGESSHTPFRLTEKHFKNRSQPLKLPSLRQHRVLDLSRPDEVADDEVWKAGWWSPENDTAGRVRRGKGKERERGERPEVETEGLKRLRMNDGRIGWLVAPGKLLECSESLAEQKAVSSSLDISIRLDSSICFVPL